MQKSIEKIQWGIIALVIVIAAVAIGGYKYRLDKLSSAVVNYKYGLAAAQTEKQAMAVAQQFDYETSGVYAKQASAGLGGFFKAIAGKGWLWGKGGGSSAPVEDNGWNPDTEEFESSAPPCNMDTPWYCNQ